MVDTTIILITDEEQYQDEDGVWRTRDNARREIFARVESVGRLEFFSGGQAGFRPDYQFTVFAAEYQGEELCEYNGAMYSIYRSYHVPGTDSLELYVHRKVGTANGAE